MAKPSQANLSLRLKYYLKMCGRNPKSKYFVPLAETYLALELLEKALEILQEGLKWHPTYFIGRTLLAQTYFQMGHFTQSFIEAQKVASIAPSNLLALRICATSALKLQEFEKAKYFLDQLLKLIPDDQEILKLRTHLEKPQPFIPNAIEDFKMVDLSIFSGASAFKKGASKEKKVKILRDLLEKMQKSS